MRSSSLDVLFPIVLFFEPQHFLDLPITQWSFDIPHLSRVGYVWALLFEEIGRLDTAEGDRIVRSVEHLPVRSSIQVSRYDTGRGMDLPGTLDRSSQQLNDTSPQDP